MESILQVLAQQPSGVGIFSIAKQTGIQPVQLRQYFTQHKNYFVQLPQSQRFTINRFADGKGATSTILTRYEKSIEKKKSENFWYYFTLFVSLFTVLINTL